MDYRDILVHVDSTPASDLRLHADLGTRVGSVFRRRSGLSCILLGWAHFAIVHDDIRRAEPPHWPEIPQLRRAGVPSDRSTTAPDRGT